MTEKIRHSTSEMEIKNIALSIGILRYLIKATEIETAGVMR